MTIDTKTNEALRQRFNPDGSALRTHQMKLLEMLKRVDAYCRHHGIKYWLSSGTCLGAVRHSGFVPWDDDVDIEMLHEDHERLKKALKTDPIPGLDWQDSTNDPAYVQPFAKFRDASTHIHEAGSHDDEYRFNGVYIDVFQLYPSNSRSLAVLGVKVQNALLYRPSASKASRRRILPATKLLAQKIAFPIIRLLSRPFAGHRLRHTPGTAFLKPRDIRDFRKTILMRFEDADFPVPEGYDAYLRRIYGDYLSLPDLDSLPSHLS